MSNVIFPENTDLIIKEILEKNEVENNAEEIKKNIDFLSGEDFLNIIKNLPSAKVAKLVKNCATGEIIAEEISSLLEKELDISKEKAEKIADELKKRVLILAEPFDKGTELNKKINAKKDKKNSDVSATSLKEKPNTDKKNDEIDVYREAID